MALPVAKQSSSLKARNESQEERNGVGSLFPFGGKSPMFSDLPVDPNSQTYLTSLNDNTIVQSFRMFNKLQREA